MSTLYSHFQHDDSPQSLTFTFPAFHGTSTNLGDQSQEPFEFHMRGKYKIEANTVQISFYIKKISNYAGTIKNILEDIENYKQKANEIKITPAITSEILIGTRQTTFSNHFHFYTEESLSEGQLQFLTSYCENKPFSIQIRTMKYLEFMQSKQKIAAFISHDSRDKKLIAKPIADGLNSRLCPVWYDEYSLKIGDNLRQSIEKGIKEANRCVLVLTKNFFKNSGWTKREFETIFAREMIDKESIVVPVWYGVKAKEVYDYCGSLSQTVALIWPSQRNKSTEQYNLEVQGAIDKLYNILKPPAAQNK